MSDAPILSAHPKHRRASKAIGCCGTPVLFALVLLLVYTYNNRLPDIKVPTHSVPADNGWSMLQNAYQLTRSMKHLSPYDLGGTPAQNYTLANFKNCAKDARPALDLMQQALDHPLVCTPVRSLTIDTFPQMAHMRELERENAGAADYYAISGDPSKAMEMRLNGMELGAALPRGGVIIHDLVGIACEAIAASRVKPLLPRLSVLELKRAADRLDRIAARRTPFSEIVREAGYSQTATIQEALNDLGPEGSRYAQARALIGTDDDEADATAIEKAHQSMLALRFMVKNKRVMIEENAKWYEAVAKEVQQPYSGSFRTPVPSNMLADLMIGLIPNGWSKHVTLEAVLAILRTEVALYRYRAAYHRFPTTLSELYPTFLAAVPVDPFGGGPNRQLRYSLNPDGSFLLYSIGPDMKDDGGMPTKHSGDMGGDIVAGKLYQKKPILYSDWPRQ